MGPEHKLVLPGHESLVDSIGGWVELPPADVLVVEHVPIQVGALAPGREVTWAEVWWAALGVTGVALTAGSSPGLSVFWPCLIQSGGYWLGKRRSQSQNSDLDDGVKPYTPCRLLYFAWSSHSDS